MISHGLESLIFMSSVESFIDEIEQRFKSHFRQCKDSEIEIESGCVGSQFAELGVIDRRWLHSAAWGRMRGGVGSGGSSPSSSAGFCISSGSDEPLGIPAPYRRANPGRHAGIDPAAGGRRREGGHGGRPGRGSGAG